MMTITEALAELKLIANKVAKKREWVSSNVIKYKQAPDAYEKDGGIKEKMKQELQSIKDLQEKLVKTRSAIMRANLDNIVDIMGESKSIYEWLVWRKDVARDQAQMHGSIYSVVKREIEKAAETPRVLKSEEGVNVLVEIEPNLDYQAHNERSILVQEILDKLDGVLSLKNATITVNV